MHWYLPIDLLPEFITTQLLTMELQPRIYFLTIILTGMRNQEPMKLQWQSISLSTGKITIRGTKNHKDLTTYLISPLLQLYNDWRLLNPHTDNVFIQKSYDELWAKLRKSQHPIWQKINAHNEEHDPKYEALRIHDLRRTFKDLLLDLEIDPITRDRLENHALKTAGDRYHVAERDKQKAMNKVNQWWIQNIKT